MPRAYEFVLDVLYFNTPILFGLYTVYIQNSLTNQDDNHIFEEHLWSRKINPCRDGLTIFRSSRLEVFCKKRVLRPATLLKKILWHRCFPVNFAKFLRTPFLQNTSGRLLLVVSNYNNHPSIRDTNNVFSFRKVTKEEISSAIKL